jgi:hypothetical protein
MQCLMIADTLILRKLQRFEGRLSRLKASASSSAGVYEADIRVVACRCDAESRASPLRQRFHRVLYEPVERCYLAVSR